MKIINTLRNLENIDSLAPEQLSVEARAEVIQEVKDFIDFWEGDGRESLKDLIAQLRNKIK